MKREGIAYGPVIGYTALLIAASGALGWVVTGSWYPLAILLVPVIGIAAYRLIGLYSDSIRRVTFMFNAIDNDDFTFRFHEDPSKVDNGMLNAALNRIKEILVRAKVRAEERERYYQLIMEYARTGLITINDAGSVYQANGEALRGLIDIVDMAGAQLMGVGVAVEKGFQAGGKRLRERGINLQSLAIIEGVEDGKVRFRLALRLLCKDCENPP